MLRGQPTVFGRCQAYIRECEVDDLLQAVVQTLQLLLQMNAQRSERRDTAGLRPHGGKRIAQHLSLMLQAVLRLHGTDQGQSLLPLQTMLFNAGAHLLLQVLGKRAEAVSQRYADVPRIHSARHRLAQVVGQRQSLPDPPGLLAATRCDSGRPHLLSEAKVVDHPGLIHRRQGAGWSVGLQQRHLGIGVAARSLQHHGHLLLTLGLPATKSFEPIDHLEGAVAALQHPQGHLTQRRPLVTGWRETAGSQH
jgi:hypothetical protein